MTDNYLSYSGFKSYQICPKKYELCYILQVPYEFDPRTSMLGSTLGKVIEWFYSRQYWKMSDPLALCNSAVSLALEWTYKKNEFDPRSDPIFCRDLKIQVIDMIPQSIKIIREKQLLTICSRAEVDLSVIAKHQKYDFLLKIGGRCDFIHGHNQQSVFINEGKASKWKDKYVDANQLIWYGVQHYIKFHVVPSQLGFIFWAFPDDPVKWIEYDAASMKGLFDEIFSTYNKIRLKLFDPTPSHECKLCNYKSQCHEGTEYLEIRKLETDGRIDTNNIGFSFEQV
jgi:hypothetical protein